MDPLCILDVQTVVRVITSVTGLCSGVCAWGVGVIGQNSERRLLSLLVLVRRLLKRLPEDRRLNSLLSG